MVQWGHGETPRVPTTNQISLASVSEKSHHPQQSCLATAGLKIVGRVFFQLSSLTLAQVKHYIFLSGIIASRFSYFQLCC